MPNSRFDQAAASWDEQPARVQLAQHIGGALLRQVPVHQSMTVIDFGCGTGLLSLLLQPSVSRVIGIDSSPGMLAKMQEKVGAMGITNVETRLLDLTTQPAPDDLHADLIVSAMALHHIDDITALLRTLTGLLTPGGFLALADLDTEDGSFHPDPTAVYHHGIDRTWLVAQLTDLNFQQIQATTAHTIERPDASGTLRRYTVFLVSAQARRE